MTDEQIRIAIAEACGWQRWKGSAHDTEVSLMKPRDDKQRDYWLSCGNVLTCEPITNSRLDLLPNYPADLNAMHEAEKTLKVGDEWFRYYSHFVDDGGVKINATARQRAEAFLKVKGLWK